MEGVSRPAHLLSLTGLQTGLPQIKQHSFTVVYNCKGNTKQVTPPYWSVFNAGTVTPPGIAPPCSSREILMFCSLKLDFPLVFWKKTQTNQNTQPTTKTCQINNNNLKKPNKNQLKGSKGWALSHTVLHNWLFGVCTVLEVKFEPEDGHWCAELCIETEC